MLPHLLEKVDTGMAMPLRATIPVFSLASLQPLLIALTPLTVLNYWVVVADEADFICGSFEEPIRLTIEGMALAWLLCKSSGGLARLGRSL